MVDNSVAPDYYTVLQVHPTADREVIEAAYRQLMKKYHPDVAGLDAALAEQFHERASIINRAYSVLRDPVQRRRYDGEHGFVSPPRPRPRPPTTADPAASPVPNGAAASQQPAPPQPATWEQLEESLVAPAPRGPASALSAAYYLLPGPYEWDGTHRHELLTTLFLIPVGVAAFMLATGRLAPLLGHSMVPNLVAAGVLLLATLPSWWALPRLAMASVPSALVMTGVVNSGLQQASVPLWLAWVVAGFLSLTLSARFYIFAVLPALGLCWLLSRLG